MNPVRMVSKRVLAVIVIFAVSLAVFGLILSSGQFLEPGSSTVPFDYSLTVNQTEGTLLQGQSLHANLTVAYIQGDPQNVALNVSGGPKDAAYAFSVYSGTPTPNSTFQSELTVSVPAYAPSGSYTLNITSTARNGKTQTVSYMLNVLNANVNVSGRVTADFNQDVFPVKITFTSTSTNQSFTTHVYTTPSSGVKSSMGWLVQTGRYSVSLPNHDSYTVVCTWYRLPGPWNPQGEDAAGTFGGGVISVDCGEGASLEGVDFSD